MSLPEEGVEKRTASPATAPPQITPVIKDLAFDIKGDLLIFVRIHDVKKYAYLSYMCYAQTIIPEHFR